MYLQASQDTGATFGGVQQVSSSTTGVLGMGDGGNSHDPGPITAASGGHIYIVWQDNSSGNGDIYFVTGNALYHLVTPARGDCNGDGKVDADDIAALAQALLDGPYATTSATNGNHTGSWGCDVNGDGMVDARDMTALVRLLSSRTRSVRPR